MYVKPPSPRDQAALKALTHHCVLEPRAVLPGRDVRAGPRPGRLRAALERHREGGEEILRQRQEDLPGTSAGIRHTRESPPPQ